MISDITVKSTDSKHFSVVSFELPTQTAEQIVADLKRANELLYKDTPYGPVSETALLVTAVTKYREEIERIFTNKVAS